MKTVLTYVSLLALLVVYFFAIPSPMHAQMADTLDIQVLPAGNINAVINGDTLANGLRAHPDRAYRLKRGAVYQFTETMKINGDLNLIATEVNGDPDELANRPPVIVPGILPDDSSPTQFFDLIGKSGKISMNDLYLLSRRADNVVAGWDNYMTLSADSISLKLRDIVFDSGGGFGILIAGHWSKIDMQDCVFRNNHHSLAWIAGGSPMIAFPGVHMDTLKVINNTFFAVNGYIWSVRGYDHHSVFEHNTLVYTHVNPFLAHHGSNVHIKNNLFYSVHSLGWWTKFVLEDPGFSNWPDTTSTSLIHFTARDSVSKWSTDIWNQTIPGPEVYIDPDRGVTAEMLDPTRRVIDVQNNAYFWPKKLFDYYDTYNANITLTDSVKVPDGSIQILPRRLHKPRWITEYTQWTFDNLFPAIGVQSTLAGNMEADPMFDPDIEGHVDALVEYMDKTIHERLDLNSRWSYDPGGEGIHYPPPWPLPENLAFSNPALQNAGTDGFAVGDLNWFPEQKEQWLKQNTATAIEHLEGRVPTGYRLAENYPNPFNPSTTIEFEVPKAELVTLKVYNTLGQLVSTLVNQHLTAGAYKFRFDASNLSSGIYFYALDAGDVTLWRKMIFLK